MGKELTGKKNVLRLIFSHIVIKMSLSIYDLQVLMCFLYKSPNEIHSINAWRREISQEKKFK